jgi:hypothetical protein
MALYVLMMLQTGIMAPISKNSPWRELPGPTTPVSERTL